MPDLLPENDYYVRASQEPVLGYSSNMVPEVALMLTITQGDHEGTKLAWYGFFSDQTWERTVKALRLMGWAGDDVEELTLASIPNEVIAVVKHEEYEGVWRARVAFINDPERTGLVKNVMDEDEKRRFAADLKAKIASVGGAGKAAPYETSPDGREVVQQDDDAPPF